jgi:hypothetical protein
MTPALRGRNDILHLQFNVLVRLLRRRYLRMPGTRWSPRTVPYGADQTAYLVVDRFTSGSAYCETEIERIDLETIIDDFMTGQFSDPVKVIAFNTLEHWSDIQYA